MPTRRELPEDIPDRVRNVLRALGTTTRVEALLFFSRHRTASRQDLAAGTAIPFGSTGLVVDELRTFGYLSADQSEQRGLPNHPRLYTLDRGRLYDDIAGLLAHIAHLATDVEPPSAGSATEPVGQFDNLVDP